MEDTTENQAYMQSLLDEWNRIEDGISNRYIGTSGGETFHKEFYTDISQKEFEISKAREKFKKELESKGILEEFLRFEEEKSEQRQELSRKRKLKEEKINKDYQAIMKPIFEELKAGKKVADIITFGVWLPQIETQLSSIVNDRNFSVLNYEEKNMINEANPQPQTYKDLEDVFYKRLEELQRVKELQPQRFEESQPYNEQPKSLEELYNLYRSNNEDILNNLKLNRILTKNPNIDTSFIPDGEFTPLARKIGLKQKVIERIRANRFKKKRPLVSAFFGYGNGGKTKRRKNKKTKRRKNKKTKRRKNKKTKRRK